MKFFLLAAGMFFVPIGLVLAQKSEVFVADGAAAHGYDVVAYFTEGKPVKGNPAFVITWKGTPWRFANASNLAAFQAAPEKYAPQYGGYCAYGSADGEGHKAPTDPRAWTIVGEKLYLNYNKNVQNAWKKDPENYIQKADKNWPTLKTRE